jgi:hypothetical protein
MKIANVALLPMNIYTINESHQFVNQKLLPTFAAGNFKPLLLKAMLRFKHGIT